MKKTELDIIVCGGRNFHDRELVFAALDKLGQIKSVTQGGADGADALAREWARARGADLITVHANWKQLGKKAGPVRNQRMIDEHRPHLLVAFPGGKGTADMVKRARAAAVKIVEVKAICQRCRYPITGEEDHIAGYGEDGYDVHRHCVPS